MGWCPVIVSSHRGGCLSLAPFMMVQSLLRCLHQRVGISCSPGPDGGLLSGPVAPFLEETIEVPMWVRSSSSLDCELLTSSVSSPGSSHPCCHGSLSRVSTSPVWSPGLFLTPRDRNLHSRSGPFSHFVTFWHLCEASWSPPLFPRPLQRSLASCLAALPLPHYHWSRDHGQSSAGLI